jgi:hypothetical protein
VLPWDWRHGPKDGQLKKSKSGICRAPESSSCQLENNFTVYPTRDACLASGGRRSKKPGAWASSQRSGCGGRYVTEVDHGARVGPREAREVIRYSSDSASPDELLRCVVS